MIGLWDEHKYVEVVEGFRMRHPRFLPFIDLSSEWGISDADAAEMNRLSAKAALDGDLTPEEKEFVDRMHGAADVHQLYALAFADKTDAKDMERILADDSSGRIRAALIRLCDPAVPEHIPAYDHVYLALKRGMTVVPMADMTIRQGLVMYKMMDEAKR